MNITEVVEVDHRLETKSERSREELARHRWHWTLDESNPQRMSIAKYARQVGRADQTIRDMVNGYAEYQGAPLDRDLSDCIARAKMQGDTRTATEAVAKAEGIGLESARRHYGKEVRQVKNTATERAERKGTTPAEEMQTTARQVVAAKKAAKRVADERRERHTLAYIALEGKLAAAMRYLRDALRDSEGVPFGTEERDLLVEAIGQLRAILNLLDMRMAGSVDVDWDAELAKIGGQS